MGRRLEYEVKTSVRLNMSNPQHVKINDVIQNLDPKIFKSKNQFIIDAIQFYIDNYGKETFVIKKKEKERAEYIRSVSFRHPSHCKSCNICIVHNIFCRFLCFTIGCLHYYRLTNIHPGYHSA